MDNKEYFLKIASALRPYQKIFNQEVIYDYQNFRNYYPEEWIAELKEMSEKKQYLFDTNSEISFKNSSLKNFYSLFREISQIKQQYSEEKSSYDPHTSYRVKEKKLHELGKIQFFLEKNLPKKTRGLVDLAGGVGHLARVLARELRLPVSTIDSDSELHRIGKKRMIKYPIPKEAKSVSFVTDKLTPFAKSSSLVKKSFGPEKFSLGLHTCGPLSLFHFDHAYQSSGIGLLNFGCCYIKLDSEKELNLSLLAREEGFPLKKYALTLATRGNNFSEYKDFQLKKRVKQYRYLFHLVQEKLMGLSPLEKIGDSHKKFYEMPFEDFATKKIQEHQLPPIDSKDLKGFFQNTTHQKDFEEMFCANLIRWRMGRAIELYILLDRALFLEEKGYQSSLIPLFDEKLSPRNIGIFALRKDEAQALGQNS